MEICHNCGSVCPQWPLCTQCEVTHTDHVEDEYCKLVDEEDGTLTPEQVKYWRTVLVGIIGPYALIMSTEKIQAFRDKMEGDVEEK